LIWPTEKILQTFREVTELAPDYLPAAYCWARVASAHLDISVALPLLEKVTNLLLNGCSIPFSCADFFFMDPETQYDFERTAWESLEKDLPLDDGLRPLILEDVLVIAARLAKHEGDLKLVEDTLKLAIARHPKGGRARPLLAELLEGQENWELAAAMWREHLAIRPLHFEAHESLLALAQKSEDVEISDDEVNRYERALKVVKG